MFRNLKIHSKLLLSLLAPGLLMMGVARVDFREDPC